MEKKNSKRASKTSPVGESEATKREKRLEQEIKELSILYDVSKILASALELDKALDLIVKSTAKRMGVKACGLRLFDEGTGEMRLQAVYGLSKEYMNKGRVFMWKGVYRDVVMKGQAVMVDDVATDPRFEYTEAAIREGIKSMLSVGLIARDKQIGALSIYTSHRRAFTKDQVRIFKGIANEAAAVIERAKLYEEQIENQRTEQELATAAKIQSNLMPAENPSLAGFELAARNVPSRTVGGDFYDFIFFDEFHLGIVIADVSGKGIPGAILMASARASLRAYLEDPHEIKDIIARLNRVLFRDTQKEQFVSLFYGMVDTQDCTITYVNAGHNIPVLLRDHDHILLHEGGLVLGVMENASYDEGMIQIAEGDLLLLYTDGITEAARGDEYFGEERLMKLLQSNIQKHPAEILESIFNRIAEFSGNSPQSDDRTVVVLKKLPYGETQCRQ